MSDKYLETGWFDSSMPERDTQVTIKVSGEAARLLTLMAQQSQTSRTALVEQLIFQEATRHNL